MIKVRLYAYYVIIFFKFRHVIFLLHYIFCDNILLKHLFFTTKVHQRYITSINIQVPQILHLFVTETYELYLK
jgi:hypothetical protein